jgi:hypothetical protein
MDTINLVIKIAGFITALGVIITAAVKVISVTNKIKKSIDAFSATVNDLKEHSAENYLSLLRLTIMSSEMPIGERIVAGHKYLQLGGNGDVKNFLKAEFNIDVPVSEASHYKP